MHLEQRIRIDVAAADGAFSVRSWRIGAYRAEFGRLPTADS
jgi:hypothetical protein